MINFSRLKPYLLLVALYVTAYTPTPQKLPIYGERTPINKMVNGVSVVDTVYQTIPHFNFLNQDNITR